MRTKFFAPMLGTIGTALFIAYGVYTWRHDPPARQVDALVQTMERPQAQFSTEGIQEFAQVETVHGPFCAMLPGQPIELSERATYTFLARVERPREWPLYRLRLDHQELSPKCVATILADSQWMWWAARARLLAMAPFP